MFHFSLYHCSGVNELKTLMQEIDYPGSSDRSILITVLRSREPFLAGVRGGGGARVRDTALLAEDEGREPAGSRMEQPRRWKRARKWLLPQRRPKGTQPTDNQPRGLSIL